MAFLGCRSGELLWIRQPVGWQADCAGGQFRGERMGLHDMHGNVFEWVEDCWHANYSEAPSDGSARRSEDCSKRVSRGGSWNTTPWLLRAAYRNDPIANGSGNFTGFRVARTLTP